jgi:hypothetical protein
MADDAALDSTSPASRRCWSRSTDICTKSARMLVTPQDLDTGPVSALDLKLGDLDLAAHVDEDLFRTKVAFFALLNYPVNTLTERLAEGTRGRARRGLAPG